MNIPKQVLDTIKNSFDLNKLPKRVKTRPCRIKFMGEYITTNSRKTVWRNKAFAKAAFRCHLQSSRDVISNLNSLVYNNNLAYYKCDEIRDDLEKLGILQFIEEDVQEFNI
jgi:hypothetical protein